MNKLILKREFYLNKIKEQLKIQPICAILGPRQVGKTTLAKQYAQKLNKDVIFFDLENPIDLAKLENPMLAFTYTTAEFIIIDEIQRRPDLFTVLRVLVDNADNKKQFLILGSASRELIQQSSETLAGRIGYIELPPFSIFEVDNSQQLFLKGGFPKSYLAKNNHDSFIWRLNYISTFLERDIPNLGFSVPPILMRRFWLMLAHYHGQIFNANEIAKSLGVSGHTVRKYLDILAGTFMIRILLPWFENLEKRQVKSPKIYFRDSGILNALLSIENGEQLFHYPKLGSFWEGFAIEEVIRILNVTPPECFFWATHANAELDLLVLKGGKRLGFEFKFVDKPKITKSIRIAQKDLFLDKIFIIYPGKDLFMIENNIFVVGLDVIYKQNLF